MRYLFKIFWLIPAAPIFTTIPLQSGSSASGNAMLWLAQASAILAIRLAQVGAVATVVSVPTPIFKSTLSAILCSELL
jgi:hypothetical protein